MPEFDEAAARRLKEVSKSVTQRHVLADPGAIARTATLRDFEAALIEHPEWRDDMSAIFHAAELKVAEKKVSVHFEDFGKRTLLRFPSLGGEVHVALESNDAVALCKTLTDALMDNGTWAQKLLCA
jgi:hypothetical protein